MKRPPPFDPSEHRDPEAYLRSSQLPEFLRLLLRLPAFREDGANADDPEAPDCIEEIVDRLAPPPPPGPSSPAAVYEPESLAGALKSYFDVLDVEIAPSGSPEPMSPDDGYVMAYLLPLDPTSPPTDYELRTFLRRRLPKHVLPDAFVTVDDLPVTRRFPLPRYGGPDPCRFDGRAGVGLHDWARWAFPSEPPDSAPSGVPNLLVCPAVASAPIDSEHLRVKLMTRTSQEIGASALFVLTWIDDDLALFDVVGSTPLEDLIDLIGQRLLRQEHRSLPIGTSGFVADFLEVEAMRYSIVTRAPASPEFHSGSILVAAVPSVQARSASVVQALVRLAESLERLETVSFPDDAQTLINLRIARAVVRFCHAESNPSAPVVRTMDRLSASFCDQSQWPRSPTRPRIYAPNEYKDILERIFREDRRPRPSRW